MQNTIEYYNKNVKSFVEGTRNVDFTATQNAFLDVLPKGAYILDFGCGSGRDTKYFLDHGYRVDAMDGSIKLCKAASTYTGIEVKHMLFQELNETEKYDGIWACASILHLPKKDLKAVFEKMIAALKENGYIYSGFKYGEFEGYRNDRYFTDFTIETFTEFMYNIDNLTIEAYWVTGDVRPGRGEEKWLNLILKKTKMQ